MEKITNTTDLKAAIQHLEYKQAGEWSLLKKELFIAAEELKPASIIKNTFKEMAGTLGAKPNIVNAAIGLTTGIVAKKIVTGKTNNPLKKLLGTVLEMIVATKVAKNADGAKAVGSIILKKIFTNHKVAEKVL